MMKRFWPEIFLVFLTLILGGFIAGCGLFSKNPQTREASVDKSLIQKNVPAPAPLVKPKEPQREFEQEPRGAQG